MLDGGLASRLWPRRKITRWARLGGADARWAACALGGAESRWARAKSLAQGHARERAGGRARERERVGGRHRARPRAGKGPTREEEDRARAR
jgi:hypothetical protein